VSWVKGHQDSDDPDLPVEAKYNIRADKLAGQSSFSIPTTPNSTVVMPGTKCVFQLGNRQINGHYTRAVRNAYLLPQYFAYLEERHNWTTTQRQSVDWKIFERAASAIQCHQVQLVKLVHRKLPTNHELHKSNPHHSAQCHYCNSCESFNHLLLCNSKVSQQFRDNIIEEISTYMIRKDAPPTFQSTFIATIQQQMGHTPTTAPHSPDLRLCQTQQTSLGPSSLLQGFYTQTWRKFYDKENTQYGLDQHTPSIDFFSGLINLIWNEQLKFWDNHLQETNNTTNSAQTRTTADKLLQYKTRIRLLHAQRHLCLPAHQDIYFHEDVDEYLQTATGTQMHQYLHHYEPAITHSIRSTTSRQTRTLFTFPGFQLTRDPNFRCRHIPPLTRATENQATNTSLSSRGTHSNIQNRKHTRWKSHVSTTITTLRKFFQPNNT